MTELISARVSGARGYSALESPRVEWKIGVCVCVCENERDCHGNAIGNVCFHIVTMMLKMRDAIGIKAMRLEKKFGLSTFLVFRLSRYFEVRNKSGIWVRVSEIQKFRETYQKFSRKCLPKIISENVPIT